MFMEIVTWVGPTQALAVEYRENGQKGVAVINIICVVKSTGGVGTLEAVYPDARLKACQSAKLRMGFGNWVDTPGWMLGNGTFVKSHWGIMLTVGVEVGVA